MRESMRGQKWATVRSSFLLSDSHANIAINAVGEKREEASTDADAAYGVYEREEASTDADAAYGVYEK